MKKKFLLIILMLQATMLAFAQTAYGPYLQSPTPNSMWVSWVTTSNTETILTWGTSSTSLTNTVTGTANSRAADHIVHDAQITGLQPNTAYYYQVKTGSYTSPVYRFVSAPALGTSTGKIHYVVFGDTQDPTSIARVAPRIEQKLIQRFGTNWEDSCRFMIKLGDNVDNGGSLPQYKERFIGSIKYVSPKLPLMTVPGNHEYYSDASLTNYFAHVKYENVKYNNIAGQDGEHYYAFPYANMLFLMFNSNETWQRQTDFMNNVVNTANTDNNVKWIFSACHHPVQVERLPSDMSAYVANTVTPIMRNSPKGTSMYAGHSHLYQRGATREGSLSQIINGGASWIERWGTSTQTDYPDVQKCLDHYLFQIVTMDLTNNEMSVQTYSNGTDTYDLNNVVIDTYFKKLGKPVPAKPTVVAPPTTINLPYTFQGGTYSGTVAYNSTQFQIVETTGSFNSPKVNVKRDFENIYLASNANAFSPIDQNAGIDIFKYTAAAGVLQAGANKIRVRYRDQNLNWSAWSDSVVFTVGNGTAPAQQNPIAWYKFSNNTLDTSGFNRNATNTGITFAQDALVKSSVGVFNNTAYADIATTSAGLPVKNITVSAWVNVKTADQWGGFFGYVQDNGATEKGWVLGTTNSQFSFGLRGAGSGAMTYLSDPATFNLNQWYHVVGTYDGVNLKLFVNGALKATSTAQSGNISYQTNGWFTLGRYKDDDENFPHDGMLDDVKMWERTLSDAEVAAEYSNTNQIALPIAEFSTATTTVTAGGTVTFNNQSHNATSYSWSFPGGTPSTSTAANPTVTYSTVGKYDVSLTANGPGGTNTQLKAGLITVTGTTPTLPAGTVAYYKFKNNTADSSGNNYHATPTAVTYVTRNATQAADFNGTTSFADIRTGTGAASILPTAAITVMAWVKVDAFDTWGGFVGCVQDNGSTENGWVLGSRNNKFSFALRSSGTALNYLTDPATSATGTWYHVAGTYDGTTLKLYVNGVQKASATTQTGAIKYAASHWLTMGRYKDEDEDWKHDGGLDEVYIVNRALSATEINGLLNTTSRKGEEQAQFEVLTDSVSTNFSVNVFPVPTQDIVQVELKGSDETITYELANQVGLVLFGGQVNEGNAVINTNNLPSGTYIIRFHNSKGIVWKRIVKE